MIHHVSVGSSDLERARRFYDPVLAVLGLRLLQSGEKGLDYGATVLEFSVETPVDGRPASAGNGVHVCFAALDRSAVEEFYGRGLANGGTDGGAPGIRREYDDHYFGAFLHDPDGNKIEAVTFSAK